jgi:hypothetical protein
MSRQRLGRYLRVVEMGYKAHDGRNRLIVSFRKRADALAAIAESAR